MPLLFSFPPNFSHFTTRPSPHSIDARTRNLRTPLHTAAFNAHPPIIAVLCDRGACLTAADASGATPLHDAAASGCCLSIMQLLIRIVESGALECVNARDCAGMTPVFTALSAGSAHVAALLRVAGADMDAADNRGVTPRDMLRISEDNCRKKSRERCSAAAALAHTEVEQGHGDLVTRFRELFPCNIALD